MKYAISFLIYNSVNVSGSPRLDHRLPFQKTFETEAGGNVTLKIPVIAYPAPTFTWYYVTNGSKVSLGSGSSTTTGVSAVGTLTLTNVQEQDFGIYQVVVSNDLKMSDLVVILKCCRRQY